MEPKRPLGPWANANLAGTVREQAGAGSTSDLPQDIRFPKEVVRVIRTRLARSGGTPDREQPAVFLLEPMPQTQRDRLSPKRVPMLDNGMTPLTGRIWFVGAAVASGHFIPFESQDDDDLFTLVTDVLSLGHIPAVIFDPRPDSPEVRFYPLGFNDTDNYKRLVIYSNISPEAIFEAIDRIYDTCMITPDAQGAAAKLWKQSRKWYPVKNAEALIQSYLLIGLNSAFPSCIVRQEQPGIPGRVDLEIEEVDPFQGVTLKHAILELKVLRSFGSTGKPVTEEQTISWIESGVKQAAAYKKDKAAKWAALCCFDMRKEDSGESCFEEVRVMAESIKVALRRWYLFASAVAFRDSATH